MSCGIHLRTISQEELMNSICNIYLSTLLIYYHISQGTITEIHAFQIVGEKNLVLVDSGPLMGGSCVSYLSF